MHTVATRICPANVVPRCYFKAAIQSSPGGSGEEDAETTSGVRLLDR